MRARRLSAGPFAALSFTEALYKGERTMDLHEKDSFAQSSQRTAATSSLFIWAAVIFVCLFAGSSKPVQGIATYQDAWGVGDAEAQYIVGCGVTEANYGDDWELHNVKVVTTLRSPNGRSFTRTNSVYYTWSQGSNFAARAEPTLTVDENDVGDYTLSSTFSSACPVTPLGTASMSIRIAIAVTNYIFNGLEGGYCRYDLWCPNGNASATCPSSNPVYANPIQNICRNYLHDYRLKTTIAGVVLCTAVGKAELANFALPCT